MLLYSWAGEYIVHTALIINADRDKRSLPPQVLSAELFNLLSQHPGYHQIMIVKVA
jgi:hypothetical protein